MFWFWGDETMMTWPGKGYGQTIMTSDFVEMIGGNVCDEENQEEDDDPQVENDEGEIENNIMVH